MRNKEDLFMKKKQVLSCALITSLLMASLSGCGSKEKETSKDANASNGNATNTANADSADSTDAADTTTDVSSLDPVTLKMYFHGSNVTDDSAVMEKVNEYLKEKLNVTLEPIWGTWGDFDNNAVLSLQGGDDVDIYFTCSWSADEYNKFARDGYWVRLDNPDNNLIDQYGSEIWNTLPDILKNGATINGADGFGVYALPGYKDCATQNCWDVNVDLLKKYGYTIDDIKNADYYSFGDILKTVKEGEGDDFYPLLVEGAVLERMATNSIIVTGDSGTGNMLSLYLNPDDVTQPNATYGTKIYNKFATDDFKKFVDQTREYFKAGYIDPGCGNANQANDLRLSKQKTGEYLIGTQSYALGYELQASQERGFEVAMVPTTDAYVDTTASQGAMMAISTASKNPERAMMLLNLLNTDPYLMTLLNYGVEGTHYTLEDGLVKFTDERSNYQPWTNGMGNVTILPATVDQGADFWTEFKDYYGSAKEIPSLGFAFDQTNVSTEIGSLANVVAEYMLPLCTGTVDPNEKLPEFLDKLSKNGIDTVIDEANKQLDEFMAAKGE